MDDARRAEISSPHAKELDAAFETFEHDGATYHSVGLMQAWVRGYTDPDVHMLTEPPAWTEAFRSWLERHGCDIVEGMVGPPMVRFPNRSTADLFQVEWHGRGRRRYPYKQQAEFEERFEATVAILDEMRRKADPADAAGEPKSAEE